MGTLTMSEAGRKDLEKDEGSIDGLYDDPSNYCTYGVGHLVHPTDKWCCFLLAAAKSDATWKGKLGTSLKVTYLPRSAVGWSDYTKLQEKAVELGQETIAKKRGKDFAKMPEGEKAELKKTVEGLVREEDSLLSKTPSDVLKTDLGSYETAVNTAITGVTLAQEEFDALVSLAFNIGTGNFKSASLVKKINENKYRHGDDVKARETAITEIESAFGAWNKSGGVVLAGLTTRRKEEAKRFLKKAREELETLKKAAGGAKK